MKVTQTELGVEYKIWIPCEAVSDTVDAHVQQIIAITGGMTEIPVTGVWLDAEGETIQEDVHLISFITPDPAVSVMLRSLATTLLEEGQEAVLVSHGSRCFLLTGEVEEANKNIKFAWRLPLEEGEVNECIS